MPATSAIVLVIDRLGAGWLGPYGNTWIETPNFNRLAAKSALAETAIADSPELRRVYSGYWFGRHAIELVDSESSPLPGLVGDGRTSLLLTDDPQLARLPLASGFAERRVLPQHDAPVATVEIEQTGLFRFFDAARLVVSQADRPALVWLHSRGMAGNWDAPLELRYQFADEDDPQPPDFVQPPERLLPDDFDPDELLGIVHVYAGQVVLADFCLGLLLDALDEHPAASETLLIVTSARGYPLGEHRRVGPCDQALFGELLHVPLFVRLGSQQPIRLQSIVQPDEILSLVAHACGWGSGWPLRPSLPLTELQTGEAGNFAAYAIGPEQRAIRTPAWFWRESQSAEQPQCSLYAKPDDRWEANEIASRGGDVAELLAAQFNLFEEAAKAGRLAELSPLPDVLCDVWR